jgi:hypothetical protein
MENIQQMAFVGKKLEAVIIKGIGQQQVVAMGTKAVSLLLLSLTLSE